MVSAGSVIDRSGVSIDSDRFRSVAFVRMPPLMGSILGGNVEAITLGNRIFVRSDGFEAVVAGTRRGLVVHELEHVMQWRSEGIVFLLRYVSQYIRFRLLGASHRAAYLSISYEIQARAAGAAAA